MLMLTTELPIDLNILDNENGAIARLTATLGDLQGEWAALTISEQPGITCLRWGARVKFWIPDGDFVYELSGTVVEQRSVEGPVAQLPVHVTGEREIVVRLAECHTLPQRRVTPRRMARFAVQYRLPAPGEEAAALFDVCAEGEERGDAWQSGWCIDIGAGGMRLCVDRRESWPQQIALQFNLPTRHTKTGDTVGIAPPPFRLMARVLRIAPVRSRTNGVELVVTFENLSVQEGMRLTGFLCGPLYETK